MELDFDILFTLLQKTFNVPQDENPLEALNKMLQDMLVQDTESPAPQSIDSC